MPSSLLGVAAFEKCPGFSGPATHGSSELGISGTCQKNCWPLRPGEVPDWVGKMRDAKAWCAEGIMAPCMYIKPLWVTFATQTSQNPRSTKGAPENYPGWSTIDYLPVCTATLPKHVRLLEFRVKTLVITSVSNTGSIPYCTVWILQQLLQPPINARHPARRNVTNRQQLRHLILQTQGQR